MWILVDPPWHADAVGGAVTSSTPSGSVRDGSDWLAEGQKATDEELSGMNFYVEGITAPMPK